MGCMRGGCGMGRGGLRRGLVVCGVGVGGLFKNTRKTDTDIQKTKVDAAFSFALCVWSVCSVYSHIRLCPCGARTIYISDCVFLYTHPVLDVRVS